MKTSLGPLASTAPRSLQARSPKLPAALKQGFREFDVLLPKRLHLTGSTAAQSCQHLVQEAAQPENHIAVRRGAHQLLRRFWKNTLFGLQRLLREKFLRCSVWHALETMSLLTTLLRLKRLGKAQGAFHLAPVAVALVKLQKPLVTASSMDKLRVVCKVQ